MVKVAFGADEYEAIKKFERLHHSDIWKWITDKVGRQEGLSILDVSEEPSVFAFQLAEQFPGNQVSCAFRGSVPDMKVPENVQLNKVDFRQGFEALTKLGQFDVIILKEITHEFPDLAKFFVALKDRLKDENGRIIVLARPKQPPLPIPESCLMMWRKISPTRDEIVQAVQAAGMECSSFSAAIPCSVDRRDWEKILRSGCFPAVSNTVKCNEAEIRNWCNARSPKIAFEEKFFMFLITPSPSP